MLDMIRLKATGEKSFESLALPERMGKAANIACGGCTLSMVICAAFCRVETPAQGRVTLLSALGHFLGPALTDRMVLLRVTSLRDTRTFATRQVIASQKQNDGSERACMSAQLDLIASPTDDPDVRFFLQYSTPSPHATNPLDLPLLYEKIKDLIANGDLHPTIEETFITNF